MPVNKKDYLYDMVGPWPQPNQALKLWPIVKHLNKEEKREFFWKIELRYAKNALFYRFVAKRYARKNPGLIPISDEQFCDFMCIRSYSKFMYKASHEEIREFLPGFDMNQLDASKNYFISDLYLMRHVRTANGQYMATTVCLFEQLEQNSMDKFKPVAIYVESVPAEGETPTKCTVYPEDGNSWALAKFYALMGCAHRIVFSLHSTLHFPMDALNAISKTILPKENLILKLLLPHLQYSLSLNLTVQTTKSSPIKNKQEYPFCGVSGTEDEIAEMFADAHKGVEGRYKAYPPFHFTMKPQSESNNEYHLFQMEYYNCIGRFVKTVVKHLTAQDKEELVLWAKYIEPFLNAHIINKQEHEHAGHPESLKTLAEGLLNHEDFHFPTPIEMRKDDNNELLIKLLTKILWDLSVGHAGDHYDFGMMNFNQMPMRLRVPPPAERNIPDFDYAKLRTKDDVFRHRLEWKMFYIPTNVSLLHDTDYKFGTPELQKANADFLEDLRNTELGLTNKGIRNFFPLKEIARSIQF